MGLVFIFAKRFCEEKRLSFSFLITPVCFSFGCELPFIVAVYLERFEGLEVFMWFVLEVS